MKHRMMQLLAMAAAIVIAVTSVPTTSFVILYNAANTDVIDEVEFEWDPAVNGPSNPVTVSLAGPRPQLSAGEVFLGWIARDADPTDMTEATYAVDGTINVTSSQNVELKALVKNAYKITFDANAGDDIATFTEPIMVLPGQTATQPANPTREGYTFTGWFENPEGTGDAFDFSEPVTANHDLYAGWRANTNTQYTIYIWREVMVDGNPDNTHYELVVEQTDTATSGSTVNWEAQKKTAFERSSTATSSRNNNGAFDYRYYDLDSSKNVPTVIKGDEPDDEPDKPAPGPHYTVHVAGIKTWVDDGYKAGTRPEAITIRLYADGNKSTVTSEYKKVEDPKGSTLIFSLVNTAEGHVNRRAARATGDESATAVWGLIVAAGMVLMGVWFIIMTKRRRNEKG